MNKKVIAVDIGASSGKMAFGELCKRCKSYRDI